MSDFPEYSDKTSSAGMKAVAMMLTLVIGVGLAYTAIHHLRAAPPKPPPPPQVIVKEVPKIEYVEKIVEVPVQPVAEVIETDSHDLVQRWEGCWRQPGTDLPMIELKVMKNTIVGRFCPVWGGIFPFGGAEVSDDAVHFVAGNHEWRTHIRMRMKSNGGTQVEGWIDPSDWISMMQVANNGGQQGRFQGRFQADARFQGGGRLQELIAKRTELETMSKKLGQAVDLGVFERIRSLSREKGG